MAQMFVTTNQTTYRHHHIPRQGIIPPEKPYKGCFGKEEDWYIVKDYKKAEADDFAKIVMAVHNLHKKRMSDSTYRRSYWKDYLVDTPSTSDKDDLENHLLNSFKSTYRKDLSTIKLMPPVMTTRRILSYLRKPEMYTPMSTFQLHHGSLGYNLLAKKENIY